MKISTRVSIWKANGQRCFFCEDPIAYRDLEIDHVIPQSTDSAELRRLIQVLGLPADFGLNDTRNLVPSHHDCNRRKAATQLSEQTLRFYMGIWAARGDAIVEEQTRFERAAERDDILARLVHLVKTGALSRDEIEGLLYSISIPSELSEPMPMVICFGRAFEDVKDVQAAEQKLITLLRRTFQRPLIPAEPYAFSGETLSVRLAVWNLDVDKLGSMDFGEWKLLEVEPAAKIYDEDWARALGRAIDETYNVFYAVKHGCPKCGGEVEMAGSESDSGEIVIGTCRQCGWEEYHSC